MIYCKSGPQHFLAIRTHSLMENKICMIPLIGLTKVTHHGKILMSHSMVKYKKGIPLPGNMQNMMFGSMIHALYYTTSLGIPIMQTSWILLPKKFATRMVSMNMRTLCWVIGHGGRQYMFRDIWNSNKSDFIIDNRMSLQRIQKTMVQHFVWLWPSLLPLATLNTIQSIFQMVWSTCGVLVAMH